MTQKFTTRPTSGLNARPKPNRYRPATSKPGSVPFLAVAFLIVVAVLAVLALTGPAKADGPGSPWDRRPIARPEQPPCVLPFFGIKCHVPSGLVIYDDDGPELPETPTVTPRKPDPQPEPEPEPEEPEEEGEPEEDC